MENIFKLTWKKTAIALICFNAFVLIHNLIYAIFKYEEAVFSITATIIIPLYFIISGIYSIFRRKK